MLDDAGGTEPVVGQGRRWVRPVAVVSVPVLVGLAVGGWLFGLFGGGWGHPFGDGRACPGSEVPLGVALEDAGFRLPSDATDVHYVTRAAPEPGQYALAVVFHSSSQKMESLLTRYGLIHGGFSDLGDGRFTTGDPGDPDGLCGSLPQDPVAEITGESGVSGSRLAVDVELSDLRMIRSEGVVLVTLAPGE